MKRNLVFAALVFFTMYRVAHAQYATIPDANFRACLKESYPAAFTADDLLILAEAPNIENILCINRSIADLTGVQYFTNLVSLQVKNNPITNFPSLADLSELVVLTCDSTGRSVLPEISGCMKLEILDANSNALTAFPDLTANPKLHSLALQWNNIPSVPDLSHLPELEYMFVTGNPITSLPDWSPNKKLKALGLGNIGVDEVPDLSALHDLEVLNINNNSLTNFPAVNSTNLSAVIAYNNDFTDLPDFSNTLLGTQISQMGSHLAIQDNRLTFEDMLPFAGLDFTNLMMSPQKQPNPDSYVFAQLHQAYEIKLPFDEDVTSSVYEWYKDGLLLTMTTTNSLVLEDMDYDDIGVYRARITNPNIPDLIIESGAVTITVSDNDYPAISPNNDGVADDYYIPFQGIVKIYDRGGVLVNQLSGPSTWNGTDSSGTSLPMGLYIILCDGQKEIAITIVR